MGSGSSRLGSPRRAAKVNRTKQKLVSFICGSSSTSGCSQWEDCAAESLVNDADYCRQLPNRALTPTKESSPSSSGGTWFPSRSSPRSEPGASSESTAANSGHASLEDNSDVQSSNKSKYVSERDEVIPPHQVNAESKCYPERLGDTINASFSGHSWPLSVNPSRHVNVISDIDDFVSNDMPQTSPEVISPLNLQHEELEGLPTNFEEINEVMGNRNSDIGPIPTVSDPLIDSESHGDEAIQESIPSRLGLFVSDEAQDQPEESVLHVDVLSISSNASPNVNTEISTREARRNSRRMFWDAFSSRSSRRHADFPAILFTTEDADLVGSRRRWLLDIGEDLLDDGVGVDSWHFGRRRSLANERRRNSRSELWDRLRGAASESSHRTSCPFDLHPDGSCSCELDEGASALSSISRIVLLAEALFEVLDEIHRQPGSFSLSMLSVPAPESVVDSLPLRTYVKPNTPRCEDDPDQCHICLVEYDEGDKIRALPCHHEYHKSCVDKWLKEIHGICPLCRGDVRGGGGTSVPDASALTETL